MALAISASAREESHKLLIKTGFYSQFKKNINSRHLRLVEGSQENELYGLLNIALNSKYLHLIYLDLKKIYKIVFKNQIQVEFKTKVDLFSACAKYIARITSSSELPHNSN